MVVEEDPALILAFPPIASLEGRQLQLGKVSLGASISILGSAAGNLPQVLVKSNTPPMDGQPKVLEVSTTRGQILTTRISSNAVIGHEHSLIPEGVF